MPFFKYIIVFNVIIFSSINFCFGRSKDLEEFYKKWRPLELVRGLRALSVDPLDVFRSLEAVKDFDSDDALDMMHDLDIRPITIYDALEDLGIEPFDAYYALKSWLTDPRLHPPGDLYHRVNASGDPSHPNLHVSYKKSDDGKNKPNEDFKARYLNSDEIEKELKDIEKEYKNALESDKIKMGDFITKAKKIHSSFDDPKKLFKDFFGKRHFKEWTNLFPEAFKGLKEIYKNPLGPSLSRNDKDINVSAGHDKIYEHLGKGIDHGNSKSLKQQSLNRWFGGALSARSNDAFSKYSDPSRYDKLQDESHVEETGNPQEGKSGIVKVHNIKTFYDKKADMYIECKQVKECKKSGQGCAQSVQSHVRHFDPESYRKYKERQTGSQSHHQPQTQPTQQQQQLQYNQPQPQYYQQPYHHQQLYYQPQPYHPPPYNSNYKQAPQQQRPQYNYHQPYQQPQQPSPQQPQQQTGQQQQESQHQNQEQRNQNKPRSNQPWNDVPYTY